MGFGEDAGNKKGRDPTAEIRRADPEREAKPTLAELAQAGNHETQQRGECLHVEAPYADELSNVKGAGAIRHGTSRHFKVKVTAATEGLSEGMRQATDVLRQALGSLNSQFASLGAAFLGVATSAAIATAAMIGIGAVASAIREVTSGARA